jgi:hypothetical protein
VLVLVPLVLLLLTPPFLLAKLFFLVVIMATKTAIRAMVTVAPRARK